MCLLKHAEVGFVFKGVNLCICEKQVHLQKQYFNRTDSGPLLKNLSQGEGLVPGENGTNYLVPSLPENPPTCGKGERTITLRLTVHIL